MKNAGEMSAQAWKEITPTRLRKSWQKIFPILPSESSCDEHSHSRKPNEDSDDISTMARVSAAIKTPLTEDEITEWLDSDDGCCEFEGNLSDEEICRQL